MTFRALAPVRKWSGSTAAVRASVRALNRGPSLSLMLAGPLLVRLGWREARLFSVLIGEGESAGRLRIFAAPAGADEETAFAAGRLPKSGGVRLVLGAVGGLPTGDHPPRDCLHAVGEAQGAAFVEVTLPIFDGAAARPAKAAAPASTPPPVSSAPVSAANAGRAPARAPAKAPSAVSPASLKFSINDKLFALLCTKAGIAFGCSRAETMAPGDKEAAMDAQVAVIKWLHDNGYAAAVAVKRFQLAAGDHQDALDAAEALAAGQPKQLERFGALTKEALRDAGLSP